MNSRISILAKIMFVMACGASTVALAEDRFSVEDWGKQFSQTLNKGDAKAIAEMLDFKALEKKALKQQDPVKDSMQSARSMFAQGKYDEAISTYNRIPKGNDYWLTAVEERGWGYFREDDLEKSLAQAKTLLAPQFADIVASEGYFLQALSELKLCDYKGVFETNKMFKEKQKARIMEIQDLATTGMNDSFKEVLAKSENFPLKLTDFGPTIPHLPLLFYRDGELESQILKAKVAGKALTVVSAKGGLARVQTRLEKMQADALQAAQKRMAVLAQQETDENFKIIQKLNLVEVETIQRIHTDMALSKSLFKKSEFAQTDADKLVFMDDGRPWIDELDKYQVAAKSCPRNLRRKM